MKRKKFWTVLVLVCNFLPLPAQQADSVLYKSSLVYDLVKRANPWNQGQNCNGLRNGSQTISYAEMYGGYESGGFRQNHEALSGWQAGVQAESLLHLERMSMQGRFSFEHFQGREMCGSMLVKQHRYPVNLAEFTPGTKTRQQYAFEGGLSYDLTSSWRLGGKMEFTSMNYSKRKDLRHTTYLLDVRIAPSVLYVHGPWDFGISYLLQKNAESVKAQQIGETAEEYKVFLDKGLRYGAYEQWEGNGVHLKEPGIDGFPIRELIQGGAFQCSWTANRKRASDLFYLDLQYLYGSGKAGEKDFIWFEFPSHSLEMGAEFKLCRPHVHHHFRLDAFFRHLENQENLLEKETVGGVTNAHIYASNLILTQEDMGWSPEYEAVAGRWNVRCRVNFNGSKVISSQIFPYLCTNILESIGTDVEGKVHIWKMDLGAHFSLDKGFLEEKERQTAEPGGAQMPARADVYSNQWADYQTALKCSAGLSLRCRLWKGLYVETDGSYLRALDWVESTFERPNGLSSPSRWIVSARIGYGF